MRHYFGRWQMAPFCVMALMAPARPQSLSTSCIIYHKVMAPNYLTTMAPSPVRSATYRGASHTLASTPTPVEDCAKGGEKSMSPISRNQTFTLLIGCAECRTPPSATEQSQTTRTLHRIHTHDDNEDEGRTQETFLVTSHSNPKCCVRHRHSICNRCGYRGQKRGCRCRGVELDPDPRLPRPDRR